MDKYRGVEAVMGIGGRGTDNPSMKSLKAAEEAIGRGQVVRAESLIRESIRQDPENLDAYLLLASFLESNARDKIFEKAEEIGKKTLKRELGPKAFDDDGDSVGHFWGLIETRPYMRVLGSIREISSKEGKWDKATTVGLEMLRLCPGDNMSVRSYLAGYLIFSRRYLEALNFIFNWLTCPDGGYPPRGGGHLKSRVKTDFDPSLSTKGGLKLKKSIEESWDAENLYAGAKASYELFGDCDLSRCFLKSATIRNPHIIRRILGRVKQPDDFCYAPREINGPEMAIDYLHIFQPYWYDNAALFKWASEEPEVSEIVRKKCSSPNCEKREPTVWAFSACSGCKEAWYCSKTCQAEHWKLPESHGGHKKSCKHAQEVRRMTQGLAGPGNATLDSGMRI